MIEKETLSIFNELNKNKKQKRPQKQQQQPTSGVRSEEVRQAHFSDKASRQERSESARERRIALYITIRRDQQQQPPRQLRPKRWGVS